MKRVFILSLVFCSFIVCPLESNAFWRERKKKAEKPAEVKEATPKVAPKVEETKKPAVQVPEKEREKGIEGLPGAVDAQRALREKKRRQLNNTEWKIELTILTGRRKKQSDSITFSNNQIASVNLLQRGFSATNYTLTVQENGTVIWETMQTSDKSGIAFWRGEIDANVQKMQGILSHRINNEATRDYSFRSISKKAIPPSTEE
jgi:hypothetical protein